MQKLSILILTFFLLNLNFANAYSGVFSDNISQNSLTIIKRMEYKEGIPSGILHSISLVETNIGQTGKYLPWPYTIRLNSYKGSSNKDIDVSFDILDDLIDVGYQNFDVLIDGENYYSLSSFNIEDVLNQNLQAKEITIYARSVIKYFPNRDESEVALNKLIDKKWNNFKIGIMQLSYDEVKDSVNVAQYLEPYDNIDFMIKRLKSIRQSNTWWESVGLYHSKNPDKAKRYAKNVWSMYQRVHKIKVR